MGTARGGGRRTIGSAGSSILDPTQLPKVAIDRADLSASLQSIDNDGLPDGGRTKQSRRSRKAAKRATWSRGKQIRRRIIFWTTIIGVLTVVGIVGFLVVKIISATGNVFSGGVFDLVNNQPLKQDSGGRSNFLILGTTDDDPNHPGNNLTDTIIVVSIDQKAKNAYMFSIPRDLYVSYGLPCTSGYQGKLNVYFSCTNDGTDAAAEQDRIAKTQAFIGDILGIDIQYGVHVNSVVVSDAVNAVGGIDVNIQGSNGAPGILDRNFDWGCQYKCYKVRYDNGVHHLNGEQAMFLTMARGDTAPTYGLSRSNFDREQNQQKIIMALREKALQTGTLTNISAVTGLIDAMGNNLRTNVQAKEIRTLLNIAGSMKQSDIQSIDFLKTPPSPLFTTGTIGSAGSVVYPAQGVSDFSQIRAFIKKKFYATGISKEGTHIIILNASGVAGAAQTQADKLEQLGITIDAVDNAPQGEYTKNVIYRVGATAKPATAAKLKELYGVDPKVVESIPGITAGDTTDYVIILVKVSDTSATNAQ